MLWWIVGSVCFSLAMFACAGGLYYQKLKDNQRYCQQIRQALYQSINHEAPYVVQASTSMLLGEYFWHIHRIDPELIQMVDLNHQDRQNSHLVLSNSLMQQMIAKDQRTVDAFQARIITVLGEQKVATHLEQQGAAILDVASSDFVVWDLLINDHMLNLKSVLDVQDIQAISLAHPHVSEMMQIKHERAFATESKLLTGFNSSDAYKGVNVAAEYEGVDKTGLEDTVQEGLQAHLPIIPIIKALQERKRLIQAGSEITAINKNMAIDLVTKTTMNTGTVVVGASLGGVLGSLVFMPVAGAMLGACVGGLLGRQVGAVLGQTIKELELEKQKLKLVDILEQFGQKYLPYIEKIEHYATLPLKKNQQALDAIEQCRAQYDVIQKPWYQKKISDPSFVFYDELFAIYQQQFQEAASAYTNIKAVLRLITEQENTALLAVLVLNTSDLRDVLDVDLIQVNRVYQQKRKTYIERYKLYPDRFPLTADIQRQQRLYGSVA